MTDSRYGNEASARRCAADEISDESSLLRRALNYLPQMVWSTLPDGYHDFYNDQWYEFTGAPPGSTDGEGWNEMFHPDDRARAWSRWKHSLRTGEPYEIEYRLKHRDGSYRWTLGRATCEKDQNGVIARWYGTCTDIHEQVLAKDQIWLLQNELIHVSRETAMGSMASTFAHEVNQPLLAANMFATGLRKQIDAGAPAETLRQGVDGVAEAVLRAGDIIRRLRDMAKGRPVKTEHVSANDLVRDTMQYLDDVCSDTQVELKLGELAFVSCDPIQIQQVLMNLIRNACEAVKGQQAPRVTIRTNYGHDEYRFQVEDNGAGFSAEKRDSLFEVGVSSKPGGMGVGLAISRTILEAHGSTLVAESLLPQGARFSFGLGSVSGREVPIADDPVSTIITKD